MSSDTGLFPASLISAEMSSCLPANYSLRPLQQSDFRTGFLDVLRVLTTVGDVTEDQWTERYEWMRSRNMSGPGSGEYFILVIWDGARVVGAGTLVVERKFIHDLGLVGHIEDIAVAKDQQGKKLGLRMIQALDSLADQVGCYKSILDCSEANEGFYVKCGYKRAGLQMAHYYDAARSSKV
ncbi:MAG: Glucosamine-phosphate N-acetyltransferase-like protein [Phylliscum demangeonii]|nr:MAG: Glucosamine-phosphate N-acetyltransferase-like protein [Phylliscum demangeonii]